MCLVWVLCLVLCVVICRACVCENGVCMCMGVMHRQSHDMSFHTLFFLVLFAFGFSFGSAIPQNFCPAIPCSWAAVAPLAAPMAPHMAGPYQPYAAYAPQPMFVPPNSRALPSTRLRGAGKPLGALAEVVGGQSGFAPDPNNFLRLFCGRLVGYPKPIPSSSLQSATQKRQST